MKIRNPHSTNHFKHILTSSTGGFTLKPVKQCSANRKIHRVLFDSNIFGITLLKLFTEVFSFKQTLKIYYFYFRLWTVHLII